AGVREAQRLVAAEDPATGLAVAIDIGDRYDIHPANKQELGRRLARVARHVVYGQALPPSGPVPRAARWVDGAVEVDVTDVGAGPPAARWGDGAGEVGFTDVEGGLQAFGADGPIGFELCGEGPGSCRWAQARLQDRRVLLRAEGMQPARVRYCWGDNPVCTLYDG